MEHRVTIPKQILVGWKQYTTHYKEPKQILMIDGRECYGTTDYIEQRIELNQNNNQEQMEATYIHEVVHAIDDMYNLGFSEGQVRSFANALYTLLLQNDLCVLQTIKAED